MAKPAGNLPRGVGRAGRVTSDDICDIERGARNVSLESIEKLARALDISVAKLFSYEPTSGLPESQSATYEDFVDILFVEDDPNDIETTTAALQGITNRLHVVRDGQEALDYLFRTGPYAGRRVDRPQLILLDLALPKINGLEVLRRVKGDSQTASIPVIVLTSSDQDHDLQLSRRLGAQVYIVKPVGLPDLTKVTPQLSLRWALLKAPTPAGPSPTVR